LVTSAGSVDWLCLPRFDHPPVFARLLDDDAGYFSIRPSDPAARSTWTYRPASLVLDTAWTTESGTLVVTDALALGKDERGHELGRWSPGVLLRQVRCTEGSVSVDVEFSPRPEFGLIHPRLTQRSGAGAAGPVRVGNGACRQHQLGVYGAVLDTAYTLRRQFGSLDEATKGS